jgi:hypothetical protein
MDRKTSPLDQLVTSHGVIPFPAYIPVTTFGNRYPLDNLVRPYLRRLASAVMVSYHYAQEIKEHPGLPLLIDSGGFASLFQDAVVKKRSKRSIRSEFLSSKKSMRMSPSRWIFLSHPTWTRKKVAGAWT